MAINKVLFGLDTLIDLSGDTVAADKVAEGIIFHAPDGTQQVGTMAEAGGPEHYVNGTFTSSPDEDQYSVAINGVDFEPQVIMLYQTESLGAGDEPIVGQFLWLKTMSTFSNVCIWNVDKTCYFKQFVEMTRTEGQLLIQMPAAAPLSLYSRNGGEWGTYEYIIIG